MCYRFPSVKINDAHDELYFVGYCVACRAYVPLHIRVPRLLLGFILLRAFEQRARLRLDAKRFTVVEAQGGEALAEFTKDYRELLLRTPSQNGLDLLRTERDAFEMDEQSWCEFMGRLGIDDNEEKPS